MEAKVYNPNGKKLNPKSLSCYFVGYAEKTKMFMFYCPTHDMKIVEAGKTVFLELGMNDDTTSSRSKEFFFIFF